MKPTFKNHLFLIMLFLIIISGCAYRSAMNDGKKLFEAGQYDEAVQSFEIALQKKPESADTKIWLKKAKEKAAETHYQTGIQAEENEEWTRAASEYRRALNLIPDYRDASKRLETVESAEALEHYQKGVAHQEAGKWDQALESFEEALVWAENFKDTHQKIKEVKKSAAEEYYQQALQLMEQKKYEQVLTALERCWQYVSDYKDSLKQEKKAKLALAKIHYEEGEELVLQEKWWTALDKLKKADSLVSGYQDVSSRIAFVKEKIAEEYYNKAVQVLEEAKQGMSVKPYRQAMNYLDDCLSYVSNFRDARQKYQEAQKGATLRVCIMPFQGTEPAASQLTQKVIANALSRKPELMAFVDRQYISLLLDERDLTGLGMIDASSATRIGKLAGVHAFVVGKIFVTPTNKASESTTKTGKYSVRQKYLDSEGKTRTKTIGHEFNYKFWTKSREVKLELSYQIINGIDGILVDAETITSSEEDEAVWITYPANLPDGAWGNFPQAHDSAKITSSKEPKSQETLLQQAVDDLANRLTPTIISKAGRLFD